MSNFQNGDITSAKVVREDGKYFVTEGDKKTEITKVTLYQNRNILCLPENESTRQYYDKAKADAAIDKDGELVLTYKARVTIGSKVEKAPNAKLVEYLSEEDRKEYDAIIERAKKAYEAAKAKPMTEEEKLLATIAKSEAKLAALKKEAELKAAVVPATEQATTNEVKKSK